MREEGTFGAIGEPSGVCDDRAENELFVALLLVGVEVLENPALVT